MTMTIGATTIYENDWEIYMKTVVEYHGEICDSLKELYAKKNADYGDSFAAARKEIPYYTLGRLYDKFNRIKTLTLNEGEHQVPDEAVEDTLLDLANYAIMELAERKAEADGGKMSFDAARNFTIEAICDNNYKGDMETAAVEDNASQKSEDTRHKILYDNKIVIANSKHERSAMRLVLEHGYGMYTLTVFIDEKDYDDDLFAVRGMEKLCDDFAAYVLETMGEESYVVRWDDVIHPYYIEGKSLVEVYEKFRFAVNSLLNYYAM